MQAGCLSSRKRQGCIPPIPTVLIYHSPGPFSMLLFLLLSLYTTLLAPFPCSYFFYSYTHLYSPRTRIPTHPHEFEGKDDSLNKRQKFPQAWMGNSPGGHAARVRQNPVGKSYRTSK